KRNPVPVIQYEQCFAPGNRSVVNTPPRNPRPLPALPAPSPRFSTAPAPDVSGLDRHTAVESFSVASQIRHLHPSVRLGRRSTYLPASGLYPLRRYRGTV